ncbi:hypothetical protein [Flavobacterium sp.]|uniref:hypothetical protein n=1 Tax=Flavobacterium sp. TaxID=239 RepID=UPI0026158187|nr:hypothetical protein [Flavobacterium sp.]
MSQKANTKEEVKDVKKDNVLKVVENLKPAVNVEKAPTEDAKKPIEKQEVSNLLNPSAEVRLKRLDQFLILGEKFKFLKTKEDELNKFVLSSDGTKEKISLSNASGFKFEVTNSQTIEKVLKVIQEDLSIFISKADEEVKSFIV